MWALVQHYWYPYNKILDAHGEGHGKTLEELAIQNQGGRLWKIPNCCYLGLHPHSLQNCKEIHLCSLSHPACDTSFGSTNKQMQ